MLDLYFDNSLRSRDWVDLHYDNTHEIQLVISGNVERHPGPTDCTEKNNDAVVFSTSEIHIPNYDYDFISECFPMDEYECG